MLNKTLIRAGPKLYVAYSSANTPKEGTTNLHVDISDAVNLLVYAARVKKDEHDNNGSNLLKIIEKSECSADQVERFKKGEIPGALWHIFKPQDADEIRSFIAKVLFILGRSYLKLEYIPAYFSRMQ